MGGAKSPRKPIYSAYWTTTVLLVISRITKLVTSLSQTGLLYVLIRIRSLQFKPKLDFVLQIILLHQSSSTCETPDPWPDWSPDIVNLVRRKWDFSLP